VKKNGVQLYAFVDFQYKPDKKTAVSYFESGHHAWNVGYFVTTPQFLWDQYKSLPQIFIRGYHAIVDAWHTGRFTDQLNAIYPTLEKNSFR